MVTIADFPESKTRRGKTSINIYEVVSRLATLILKDSF